MKKNILKMVGVTEEMGRGGGRCQLPGGFSIKKKILSLFSITNILCSWLAVQSEKQRLVKTI